MTPSSRLVCAGSEGIRRTGTYGCTTGAEIFEGASAGAWRRHRVEPLQGPLDERQERVRPHADLAVGHEPDLSDRGAVADDAHEEPDRLVVADLGGDLPDAEVAAIALVVADRLDVGAHHLVRALREPLAHLRD